MSRACILMAYHISRMFVFLYFQWHATKSFKKLFFAAFNFRFVFFFPLAQKSQSRFLILPVSYWRSYLLGCKVCWSHGPGVLVEFAKRPFHWRHISSGPRSYRIKLSTSLPEGQGILLFLMAEHVMRPSRMGQGWRLSSIRPALIICLSGDGTSIFRAISA